MHASLLSSLVFRLPVIGVYDTLSLTTRLRAIKGIPLHRYTHRLVVVYRQNPTPRATTMQPSPPSLIIIIVLLVIVKHPSSALTASPTADRFLHPRPDTRQHAPLGHGRDRRIIRPVIRCPTGELLLPLTSPLSRATRRCALPLGRAARSPRAWFVLGLDWVGDVVRDREEKVEGMACQNRLFPRRCSAL